MFQEQFLSQAANDDVAAVQPLFDRLVERYNQPHRFYHNLNHIETGLKTYAELYPNVGLTPVEFFTWAYHDAVYDSKRSDNEAQSSNIFLLDARTLGFDFEAIDAIRSGIQSTELSQSPSGVINDIDLSGLGATPEVYAQNTANIRKEYDWVDAEVWRTGRSAVLRSLLKRPTLYLTQAFIERFTDQAIINITTELESLT